MCGLVLGLRLDSLGAVARPERRLELNTNDGEVIKVFPCCFCFVRTACGGNSFPGRRGSSNVTESLGSVADSDFPLPLALSHIIIPSSVTPHSSLSSAHCPQLLLLLPLSLAPRQRMVPRPPPLR